MKRILVCEDEDAIRDFVVINLVRSGYDVVDVSCGEDAVKVYTEQNGNFDVALLDIMMPGMDGFALCRWIREQSSEIGIIMLSAKSQEMDKVNCLMIGADDYVTKPFSPSELVARVDAIYRRVNVSQSRQEAVRNITSGPFTLDHQSRTVLKNGEPVELTQREFDLLYTLMKTPGRVFTREMLLDTVWKVDFYGDTRTVDVHVRYLRQKLEEEPDNPKRILTVRGVGYRFADGT